MYRARYPRPLHGSVSKKAAFWLLFAATKSNNAEGSASKLMNIRPKVSTTHPRISGEAASNPPFEPHYTSKILTNLQFYKKVIAVTAHFFKFP